MGNAPTVYILPPNTLPRTLRLRGKTAVDILFREGKGGFVYPFRYVVWTGDVPPKKKGGTESYRVLFSVPKRYHKRANKRNLLRRRTKEAFRQARHGFDGINVESGKEVRIAIIYSSKEIENYQRIDKAIRRIIGQVREMV